MIAFLFILVSFLMVESKLCAELTPFESQIADARNISPKIAEYLEACDALAWNELPFGKPIVLPQLPLQTHVEHLNQDEPATQTTHHTKISESIVSKTDAKSQINKSETDKLENEKTVRAEKLQAILRFYLAQKLVQARLFDEAENILDEPSLDLCENPLGLSIHRAIVAHHFGKLEKGAESLKEYRKQELLQKETHQKIPRRYSEMAKLLEFELQQETESNQSDQLKRKMNDVRRRLGKGRTGDDTQEAEEDVMKSLDQWIEKLENQIQQQQSGESNGGKQANNPADASRLLQQKAPGNVDRREFAPSEKWGDMPENEREATLLHIEKEFPPHYRELIEQYFREMAGKHGE
ncbi:MAG: hypothetical protein ACRCUY_04405 [Thermoguttaceae bacterium]